MRKPERMIAPGQEDEICKLLKSLCFLKQVPKQWYAKFDKTLLSQGFVVNEYDYFLCSKFYEDGIVILCLYIGYMLIFETNIKLIKLTKVFLNPKFEMKDLVDTDLVDGVQLNKSKSRLSLNQAHYVEETLRNLITLMWTL